MGGYPLEEPRVREGRRAPRTERGVSKGHAFGGEHGGGGATTRCKKSPLVVYLFFCCRFSCNYFAVVRLVAALGLYAQRRARLGGCCGCWDVLPSGRDADGAGLGFLLAHRGWHGGLAGLGSEGGSEELA